MNTDGLNFSRRDALGMALAGAVSTGVIPSVLASTPAFASTILGNEAQIEAERMVLRLLQEADVEALRGDLREELAGWPRARGRDAEALLDHALLLWTSALIFAQYSYVRRANPAFIIGTDDSPRTWHGHRLEGNGIAGDNPDAIYRSAVLDGDHRYEILGQADPARPSAQLYFSISTGTLTRPAKIENAGGSKPNPDAGIITLLGDIDDEDLQVGSDGKFRIVVGGPKMGGNYLPVQPGALSLGLRQMVLDWTTPPLQLQIRRLDNPAPKPPFDVEELRRMVLADLPGFVRFWAKFPDVWLGSVAPNTVVPPAPRAGGWGFLGGLNFNLAPGEAVVVKLHPGKAKYMGFQLCDPWMIGPDSARTQCCLNLAQSTPDADGTYTYVLSPVDPGVANWLDTCGMDSGFGIMRWQNFGGPATDNGGLLRDFRVVKLSEVAKLEGVARVSPEQRSALMASRRQAYYSRFNAV
jgi:hypothetical protein